MSLKSIAIVREWIDALAAERKEIRGTQIGGKGQPEARRRFRTVRHLHRSGELQHSAGRHGMGAEPFIVCCRVGGSEDHSRKTVLALAEPERLVASGKNIPLKRCALAFLSARDA